MDFDKIIDRTITHSDKFDKRELLTTFGSSDILPMWIADMDFAPSEAIKTKFEQRLNQGSLGYTSRSKETILAIKNWAKNNWGYQINDDQLSFYPNILTAIAIIMELFSKEGDGVILQTPVYSGFIKRIITSRRKLVYNELILTDGEYKMDFEDLEKQTANPDNKIFILCNPQNPTGNVWSPEDLQKIGDICLKNNTLLISDEVHSDIVLWGGKFISMNSISEKISNNLIVLTSPGKAFNLAGITDSISIIPNKNIKDEIDYFLKKFNLGNPNIFANLGYISAYNESELWLQQVKKYIESNILFAKKYIDDNIPQIKMQIPKSTYLIWLDFRGLNLSDKELKKFIVNDAKLGLNLGKWYGKNGSGFVRMNVACSKQIVEKALKMLEKAVKNKQK